MSSLDMAGLNTGQQNSAHQSFAGGRPWEETNETSNADGSATRLRRGTTDLILPY